MYRGKKRPEGVCLPYLDVVEEALCFGWIDSTLKRLPDGRLAQRLSPRQKRSHWTELNKQRCADLEAHGLMTDLGRAALQKENTKICKPIHFFGQMLVYLDNLLYLCSQIDNYS